MKSKSPCDQVRRKDYHILTWQHFFFLQVRSILIINRDLKESQPLPGLSVTWSPAKSHLLFYVRVFPLFCILLRMFLRSLQIQQNLNTIKENTKVYTALCSNTHEAAAFDAIVLVQY